MPTEEQKEQEFNDRNNDTLKKLAGEAKDDFYKEKGWDKSVDSAKNEHTINNIMNHQFQLMDAEKAQMAQIKALGLLLDKLITTLGSKREYSIAKTKVEEAVMWAVKGLTQ